jgi:predicted  nucleic acid-binding Zn-ribbon protein
MSAYNCQRCSHQWESRKIGKPQSCPKCKSYQWQTAKKSSQEIIDEVNSDLVNSARETMREIDQTAYRASNEQEKAEDWDGWSEERQAPDYEAGETVTYRQHLRTGKKKEIRRESLL